MRKVAFVTGATGFVGSHLAEALLQRGYSEVRCLVRTEPKWLTGLDVIQIHGTLNDTPLITQALEDVQYVYHLGAMTRARTLHELLAANATSTMYLTTAVRNVSTEAIKICIASSLAVVGNANSIMADESTPCEPVSRYGRSKLVMEQILAGINLPMVIIRPPVVYGPRDQDLLTFFSAVNRGICVVPRGDPGLSLVHVNDLVRGIIDSTESPRTTGKTYYVGSNEVVTWEALRNASEAALGKQSTMIRLPRSLVMPLGVISEFAGKLTGTYPPLNREKAREILHATKQCSSKKAERDWGYSSRVSLEQGVHETIEWYRAQGWL
ncbi:MAG: NAD-dependent epimerase/dehydratase family protein [Bacteroidetes bacterium]|nr:NAD-dependent epimerase/dehydratase family protein [Bacteroidota bacterium]